MLKFRNIMIIFVLNYALLYLASGWYELMEIADKARSTITTMQTAADMALQQSQLIDEYMSYSGRETYNLKVPQKGGNGYVFEDMFGSIFGLDSGNEGNKEAIFNKMYNNGDLQALSSITAPMRKPVRYYATPNAPSSAMAWYYVPRIAYMGLDVLPGTQAVRGIKVASGGFLDTATAAKLFSDYDFENHTKTTNGVEYYNTPINMGVTYLNKDFLGSLFITNVDLLMRQKYAGNLNTPAGGDGVLKGSTYADRINGDLSMYNPINNGIFTALRGEPNSSSGSGQTYKGVTPKIEYKVIDMYDSANDELLKEVFGANTGGFGTKAQYLKSLDTDVINPATMRPYDSKPFVLAKVSFYLDVVVPYSSIAARELRGAFGGSNNFLDIVSDNHDGMGGTRRMTYTRYFAVTP